MGLKERLYSKIFFRTLFRDFGGRTAYTKDNKTFVPYFQYYIGEYQSDYNLYFLSESLPGIYYNEVFNIISQAINHFLTPARKAIRNKALRSTSLHKRE
jgi:hypothetical protein